MDVQKITFELLNEHNLPAAQAIRREDVPEDFVDTVDDLMELTRYGLEHHCKGHTFVVRYDGTAIAVILLGEAIPWETDPEEMRNKPFYRLMGFVVDRGYRGRGVGTYVLEETVRRVYQEYGVRPIALGCHEDNKAAERFWLNHGFRKTDAVEGSDYYYIRYPSEM